MGVDHSGASWARVSQYFAKGPAPVIYLYGAVYGAAFVLNQMHYQMPFSR